MGRQVWLIFAFAALFGLRAPLCVLACVDAAQPAVAQAAPADAEPAQPPCHGGPPEEPRPAPAHHECDCDRVSVAASSGDAKRAPGAPAAPMLLAPPFAFHATPSAAPQTLQGRHHASLPPPDILLRKSTLLL